MYDELFFGVFIGGFVVISIFATFYSASNWEYSASNWEIGFCFAKGMTFKVDKDIGYTNESFYCVNEKGIKYRFNGRTSLEQKQLSNSVYCKSDKNCNGKLDRGSNNG